MTVPTITALPEIPAYSDANFETKAPAVLSALRNTFVAEMNAAIAAINSYDYGAAVNANIITGQVAVANGGTGLSTLVTGRIPFGAGTGAFGNSEKFYYGNIIKDDTSEDANTKGIYVSDSGSYSHFTAKNSAGSNFGQFLCYASGAGLQWDITKPFYFIANNNPNAQSTTEYARFDTSGNFGIGTTAPAKKLEVLDTAGAQARLTHSSGNYTDFQTDGDGNLTIAPSGGLIIDAKRKIANDTRTRKVEVYKSLGLVANDTMIDALTFSSEGGENLNVYNVYMGGRLTVIVSGVTGTTDHANISKTYSISATQKKTAALVLEAVEISELSSAPASNTQTPTVTVSAKAGATGTEAILELKSTFASFTQQRITVYFEGQEASTTSSGKNRITVE